MSRGHIFASSSRCSSWYSMDWYQDRQKDTDDSAREHNFLVTRHGVDCEFQLGTLLTGVFIPISAVTCCVIRLIYLIRKITKLSSISSSPGLLTLPDIVCMRNDGRNGLWKSNATFKFLICFYIVQVISKCYWCFTVITFFVCLKKLILHVCFLNKKKILVF